MSLSFFKEIIVQQPRLVLFPQQPLNVQLDFVQQLTNAQLIGEQFQFKTQTHFLVGAQFFQHIMFLGCSPFIKTELPNNIDDVNFCHIEIVPPNKQLYFFQTQKVKAPNCLHCQSTLHTWQSMINSWQQDQNQSIQICPHCHQSINITKLDWKNRAGFASEMINIWGIFESEAVPSDSFLSQLKQWTEMNWQYCYVAN